MHHVTDNDAGDITEFDPFAGPAIEATAPSTEAQREIWTAAQQGAEASLAFNESVSVILRGALDAEALHGALRDLVARHESMRITVSGDGMTLFVAPAPEAVELPLHDWAGLDAEGERRLAELRARVVEEPFDLAHGPLVRFELVRRSPAEHVLVITAHHIVCDGWSTGVLLHDLAVLYSARVRGTAAALDAPERFTEYAVSLAELPRDEIAAAKRYWLERFAGELPVLDLPTTGNRPPVKTCDAARVDRVLPAPLIGRVRAASARQGASLFATMLSAFGVLVHRLSGAEDLVIGVPVAGQLAGRAELVGHCVQMLPLRLRLASATRFDELLRQARSTLLDAHEHQQLGFGSLLERLPIPRDPSRVPLISVTFNLDRGLPPEAMPFEGLEARMESNARSYETFELFLNAVERDGGVVLECQYNTDLFDRTMVERWLASYERVLHAVADDVSCEAGAIPLLTPDERDALDAWHGAARPLAGGELVHRLIEAQVARAPDAVAVQGGSGCLTYAELNARANRLARVLRRRGVRRGVLVGLCVERTTEMLVAMLGVLKAGGGYVPLDPDYPRERLALMVEDSGVRVLVTQARVQRELALPVADPIALDEPWGDEGDGDADLPMEDGDAAEPADAAYVIYTSGSTGKPKGVLVPHRAVANLIGSAGDTLSLGREDVVLAVTTLSFDIAVAELLLPLTVGARIVLATREVAADGLRLRRLIEGERVTFVNATPATYRLLLGAGWEGASSLRVVCTGEAMPSDLAESLLPRCGELWNAYGPTETTVWSTFWRVRAPVGRILIGRPVANTRVYVLDERRQPVPIGVKGELYIGGTGVATGYLHRPELTAERFLPDPFAPEPGARMYRTGDVVRFLPSGDLECLGRNDNQVKLRGYRIELGEIEDALARHPAVREAATRVREDRPGDKRLVGYVVLHAESVASQPTDAELREHLRQRLPDYMIPQSFVRLPAMPLTPSGKIDRRALPAPSADDAVGGDAFIEPRTDTEHMVAALWAEALGVQRLGIGDNFFALGGHSLLASQVLARLRRDHGIELSFRKIFEAPTVEQFARVLDGLSAGERTHGAAASSPLPHRAGAGPAPLSLLQERFWMLEQLDPEQQMVHRSPASWRLLGRLDAGLLEESLREVIRRHAALRTGIHVMDGVPSQVVAADVPFTLERLDLSHVPAERREAELLERCNERTMAPFDLATPPLFRAVLVRLAPEEHVLCTVQHTIVWDGWSFDLFLAELCEIYAARSAGRAPSLPELPVTYADFAAWQREWTRGTEAASHIAWWREQLAGAPPALELPGDRPRTARKTFRGGAREIAFSRAEVEALTELARAHDATLAMLLLAAYDVMLHRYTGRTDILVGSPVRARSRSEVEHVIGPFVNTIALRTTVEPELPFAALLRRVRDGALDAFSHQELPLERLEDAAPALRVSFSMQDARTRPTRMGDLEVRQHHLPQIAAGSDLMLWTMLTGDGLMAVANYATDLFDGDTALRFLRQFRTLLLSVVRDASVPVSRIPILPEEERAALAGVASDRAAAWRPVPAMFLEHAAAAHEAPAIVDGDAVVTYGALRDRAAGIAGTLRSRGVGAAAGVAVMARDVALRTAALLGVMNSGATAILVDPDDPAAYVRSVLSAADVTLAVVDDAVSPEREAELSPVRLVRIASTDPTAGGASLVSDVDGNGAALMVHWALGAERAGTAPLSHRAVAALVDDLVAHLDVAAGDVVATVHSASRDTAAVEMLLPLAAGATLALVPRDAEGDGELLADVLRERGATIVIAPAESCASLEEAEWRGGAACRLVVPGGAVAMDAMRRISGHTGRVFVAHGHPAAGGWCTLGEVSPEAGAPIIGAPLGAAAAVVLDGALQPAPTGVWGELCVGGAAVDDGRAEPSRDGGATAVRNPLAADERWLLRTGDRVRRRADGRLELGGCAENAGWLHGARTELAAIDEALRSHPAVAEAAAVIDGAADGAPRVAAYVVRAPGALQAEGELRAHVRRLLPARLTPRLVMDVESLPTGDAGRVDRTRLRRASSRAAATIEFVPPRTDSEMLLARLWLEVLHVERVGVHDNFFDLGGSSLACFQVVGRLAAETGARLSPRVLLLNTLGQAAAELARVMPAEPAHANGGAASGTSPAAGEALLQRLKRFVNRSS